MKGLLTAVIILLPVWLVAQQRVSGDIRSDTRWSGDILVVGDVRVHPGATLAIDPGTRIRIAARSDATKSGKDAERVEIVVLGKLIAEGTSGDGRIVFTSDASEPQMHDWYGIIIRNLREASTLQYCIVEYAYKGLTCYGSSPEIRNCEFRFNLYAGISAEVRAKPRITGCTLVGNDFSGLNVELGAYPIVEKSIITQNSNGVIVFDRSRVELGNTRSQKDGSAGENLIYNNFEHNIYNHSPYDIYAQNNLWNTRDEQEIQLALYDKANDPGRGKVIFLPLFGGEVSRLLASAQPAPAPTQPQTQPNASPARPATRNAAAPATTSSDQRPGTVPAAATTSPAVPASVRTPEPAPAQPIAGNTSQPASNTESTDSGGGTETPATSEYLAANNATGGGTAPPAPVQPPETSPASSPAPSTSNTSSPVAASTVPETAVPPSPPALPETSQPLLEVMIDGGKRKYIKRVTPTYPSIYQRTGFEGKVILEAIVGINGQVESYRVLRSDGDLFAEAAIEAIKQFRYQPATFHGKPVKFRVIEPFVFKLRK